MNKIIKLFTKTQEKINILKYVRSIHSTQEIQREKLEYDLCIVGGGPSGLSAAIKAKQLAKEENLDISICLLEKGAQIGSHILSGCVLEPTSLTELIPDWKDANNLPDTLTSVKKDRFYYFSKSYKMRLPMPYFMKNKDNYIVSLSQLCRWMAERAEGLGIEIYPGFPAKELIFNLDGSVAGVITSDAGIGKDGKIKANFMPGVELRAKSTFFAEGCRGSLAQILMKKFDLRKNCENQTYGLGIKEVWEVPENVHNEGLVIHTMGYPISTMSYGGGFIYHMKNKRIALGYVCGLDYKNPYFNMYDNFQNFKKHPYIQNLIKDGECLEYGARALNEGGFQSIPKLTFPGGALIGCSAGFLNVAKIKGTHNAIKSGSLAAEAFVKAFKNHKKGLIDLTDYEMLFQKSWIHEELRVTRNIRPGFKFGVFIGALNAALETALLKGNEAWTLKFRNEDHEVLKPSINFKEIQKTSYDGKTTFDLNTSLYRSHTNHDHDQPSHLTLVNQDIPNLVNLPIYDKPETRYCPAGVYEYVEDENKKLKLHINAQNCLHCKACDIKDPSQNIKWTVPESGGGGPNYSLM